MNSNQFHLLSWEKQGYRDYWFQIMSNYIQLYKRNMAWATLHPIWFFRVRYPYDSNHVQPIKKERQLDCKVLWMYTRSDIHWSLISFFTQVLHLRIAIINSCFFIWACHLNFMHFHKTFSMLNKNHHVMEIIIGHSCNTS